MVVTEIDQFGGEEEGPEEDLIPRPYQSQLLDHCLKENSIVFLPTGSGKTYIAVMLIKRMSTDLVNTYSNGGKRTFFLVNTVALAEQQKNYIKRHTHLTVGHYTGEMKVDFWTRAIWVKELDEKQVLVMTGQIFLDILKHQYIKLSDVNLLVFDECHHAVNDHCMSKIMVEFAQCPKEQHPRVLGLTATLLNSNVKKNQVMKHVGELQCRFLSTIAKIENIEEIQKFSTNPNEKIVKYTEYAEVQEIPVVRRARQLLKEAKDFVMSFDFVDNQVSVPDLPNATYQRFKKSGKKLLANKLDDVDFHIKMLGIYGGSIAAVKQIMDLERSRAKAVDQQTCLIYLALITTLTMIRKLFDDEMGNGSNEVKINRYSSNQVLTLLEILKDYKPTGSEDEEKSHGIVFVERRFTAKVLATILKGASEEIEECSFIKPDFVIGFNNNPHSSIREGTLFSKWNYEALHRFKNGKTNIMVASDVLEEGIDIPQCNLVVRFDLPKSYRSYIQSKGRARHKNSNYILMTPRMEYNKCDETLKFHRTVEHQLKCILRSEAVIDEVEVKDNVSDIAYITGIKARVTYVGAIPLLNRYCAMLPQDKYTQLAPLWYLVNDKGDGKFQCLLQLPINSPVKEIIVGDRWFSKKNAKRSAAFLACAKLHQIGELNDNLLPVGHTAVAMMEDKDLFTVYAKASENETQEQPGTKKCRRSYEKQVPHSFCDVAPRSDVELYLHVMEILPAYDCPPSENTRVHCFYKLLKSDQCYAILSRKQLPQLCDFSLFMNVGKVDCKLLVNHTTITLSEEALLKLQHFNTLLFFDLLKLKKPYLIKNLNDTENTFLIVPVQKECPEVYNIDWKVVDTYRNLPPVREPREEHLRLGVNGENWSRFEHRIVAPWYRGMLPDQKYIVTQVCDHMTPMSDFPTQTYTSFDDYFHRKYSLTIRNLEQPLFEVKVIKDRLNWLKPGSAQTASRNKRQERNDFEEHLVPELCVEVDFPSNLWMKAVLLPSCLHRIFYLLLADELRREIATDLSFPLNPETPWKPVEIDFTCVNEDTSKSNPVQNSGLCSALKPLALHLPELAALGNEDLPMDIDRERIEDVTIMDIMYFDDYINKPLCFEDGTEIRNIEEARVLFDKCPESPRPSAAITVPPLSVLKYSGKGNSGPELSHILQALTCACSNDALNLERLETLGDSFLKFSASLYLFVRYPKIDEGKLTRVKSKIIGNRNLFYCGRNRNLVGKMKVHEFSPKSDWIAPGFCVPLGLLEEVKRLNVCPSILFDIDFPREEQVSGQLSAKSEALWRETLEHFETPQTSSPSESLIGMHSVPDKMVADCVEALLGAYLIGCGIEGALRLLGWLQVLPRSYTETPSFRQFSCSAYVVDEDDDELQSKVEFLLPLSDAQNLEERLGYTFNDRGYLLQALSHASKIQNRITECYQRLEFLGDAILDFLITCHIYESCGNLSPGDLTDLRSALVNNITFGSLSVRYGFYKFCLYESSKLYDKVDNFVQFQQKNNYKITEDMLLLFEEGEEFDAPMGESVDVPKVLGDLFESLAGAIYLDSGKSLEKVWEVYYRLMKDEIEEFSKNIPKQPVRLIYEKSTSRPIFQSKEIKDRERVMVECEIMIKNEKRLYYGIGENKADAKRTAAKLALRDLL